ncbi:transketolase family protein [Consotaella aegiceratis]|uniref:transketolase family protein n=1 Tax=Consotaella aegiceratis TaxID=3097961 RepID=UPI002F427D95
MDAQTATAVADQPVDLREVMIQSFIDAVADGVNLAVVVSDSSSTSKIAKFRKLHPERVVNVGIAEQSLVGTAAGLALSGYVAVTANAAPFLLNRANEQVKNDVCYSDTNVKMMGLNAGVAYGPLASTHHAIDDVSIVRGFGRVRIFAPADPVEARQIFRYAFASDGPIYIRMDSGAYPLLHSPSYRFEPGVPDLLAEGEDVLIVSYGTVVREAVEAQKTLAEEGISAGILNVSSIRPLDGEIFAEYLRQAKRIVTVEEHSLHGGIGEIVCTALADRRIARPLSRLGFADGEWAKAGPRAAIRAYHGIDSSGIAKAVRELMTAD